MAAKNQNDLKSDINSEFADNNAGNIKPVNLRNQQIDQVDSNLNKVGTDAQTVNSLVQYDSEKSSDIDAEPLALINRDYADNRYTIGQRYYKSLPISINTIANSPSEKVNYTFLDLKAGKYLLTVSTHWSYDTANTSFVLRFQINSNFQGTSNEILRIEPKDAGGNDGDGRGTSQKCQFSQLYEYELASDGDINVILDYTGTAAGVEAAVWGTIIKIERGIENV